MDNYKDRFLHLAQKSGALKFGDFTLKSGRKSPYFFNAGSFCDGESLAGLAQCYAQVIKNMLDDGLVVEALFGPAYKGIPLVAATSSVLFAKYSINLPWAFDRKEKKDHGEGGNIVGSNIVGKKVLIIDDVLTAGTAVRASIELLNNQKATPVALLVALDRKEKATDNDISALDKIAQEFKIRVESIVDLDDLLNFARDDSSLQQHFAELETYRNLYGV